MQRLRALVSGMSRARLIGVGLICTLAIVVFGLERQFLVGMRKKGRGKGGAKVAAQMDSASSASSASSSHSSSASGELCEGAYRSCWEWKTHPRVRDLNLEIVLVGNELYQQLPTTGYGGIETSVDNIAAALYRMGIRFWAIVPGRKEKYNMPFPVFDTEVAPNGKEGLVDIYIEQVNNILAREKEREATEAWEGEGDADKAALRPVLNPNGPRNFAIWGQSMWSQSFAEHAAVEIVSHHDGGGPKKHWVWNWRLPNVRHRFLSEDQLSKWVFPEHPEYEDNAPVVRVIPHGLPPDAYRICEDKGYFLWVAGLDWGWEEKGVDIFIEMAKMRPKYKFVAYGTAVVRKDLIVKLYEVVKEVPNFEFRGELKRGGSHIQVFCEATAFVMPTHHSIGESFGMTVIESLSKGVPVIASTNGAVPEILGVEGRKGFSPYGTTCEGKDYDCYVEAADRYSGRTKEASEKIMEYAWRKFDVHLVVDRFLNYTLATLEEQGMLTRRAAGRGGRGK